MSGTLLIRMEEAGKTFPRLSSSGRMRSLWQMLSGQPLEGYEVLSGINLEVYRGQSLGLVGENGAGKSTLLKMVAGVLRPSTGSIVVNGRVGALLELGTGFHPEYTGRENIFLASSLMGLSHAEISAKLDSIIAFADIGKYIDEPVKHYSSGMAVRLGFAVATSLRPDILITDEVLAVGDEAFQRKCFRWVDNYLADGGTLLLCSHVLYHVQKLCQRALWVHQGRIRMSGTSADVTREYLAYQEEKSAQQKSAEPVPKPKQRPDAPAIVALSVSDAAGGAGRAVLTGGDLLVTGTVHSPDGRAPHVALGLVRADGTAVFGTSSEVDGFTLTRLADGDFGFRFELERIALLPGRYVLRAHAMDPEGLNVWDDHEWLFTVTGERREMGLVHLEHRWRDA